MAERIHQHYEWIRDGMALKEGWRRWVAAGGPCDPRSTVGYMSYPAYRRMLSNPCYTGVWAFGRKKNVWSNKRDYTRQVLMVGTADDLSRTLVVWTCACDALPARQGVSFAGRCLSSRPCWPPCGMGAVPDGGPFPRAGRRSRVRRSA
jgi:hypothetical protein